jgi:flagellar export protein FliJ
MADRQDEPQLKTLERWRELELEQARVEHAAKLRAEAAQQELLGQAQKEFEDSQEFMRERLQAGPLSAETLMRISRFAAVQSERVQEADTELESRRQQSQSAQSQVVSQFERLSVVEKLLERRGNQATVELARSEQKRLDDHALIHVSNREREAKHNTEGVEHGD